MRKIVLTLAALLASGAAYAQSGRDTSSPNASDTSSTTNSNSDKTGSGSMDSTSSTRSGTSNTGTMSGSTSNTGTMSGSQTDTSNQGAASGGMTGNEATAGTTATGTTAAAMPPEMFTTDMALNKIHAVNLEEIEGGKLAKTNGDKHVQSYADKMVKDHTKADKDITDLAKKKNVTLQDPTAANFPQVVKDRMQQNKAMMDQMKTMKGMEFDRHYLQMMSQGHQEVVDYLTQLQANAQDKDVKDLAGKLLPKIKDHKKTADDDLKKLDKESAKVQGRR